MHRAEGPGFPARVDAGADLGQKRERARGPWADLGADSEHPLVVRSSAPAEDAAEGSMAGRFTSVVGVQGWDAFVAAVRRELDSRAEVGDAEAGTPVR